MTATMQLQGCGISLKRSARLEPTSLSSALLTREISTPNSLPERSGVDASSFAAFDVQRSLRQRVTHDT